MREPVKRSLTLTLPMGATVILGKLCTALYDGPTTVASSSTPHPPFLLLSPSDTPRSPRGSRALSCSRSSPGRFPLRGLH